MQKVSRRIEGLLLFCLCALAVSLVAHGVGLAAASVTANRGFAPNDACVGNVRLLSLAIVQYTQDNDQLLPPTHTPQEFQAALLPFVKDPARFVCPDTGLPYVPNPALSGRFVGSFTNAETAEVLRDAKPHEDGRSTVLFLDGYIERGGVEQGDPNALRYARAQVLSYAIAEYAQDNDGVYPPTDTQAHFEAAVYSFVRSHRIFVDPLNGKAFVPNPAVSGVSLASINDPNTTEVFRDDQPYPNGVPLIAYADGHITPTPPAPAGQSNLDVNHLKQIGLGVTEYIQDFDEVLPTTTDYPTFEGQIMPFIRNPSVFTSPDSGLPYQLNPAISQMQLGNIADPSTTELARDAQRNRDGSLNTLYLDGRVHQSLFYVPKALTVGPDNATHLLWPKATAENFSRPIPGQASLWTITPSGEIQSETPETLDTGGKAVSLSVGGDNKTRLLWDQSFVANNLYGYNLGLQLAPITLETLAADGSVESSLAYGPYDGWTPLLIASGSDDGSRLLWRRYDGTLALWTVSPQGQYLSDVRLRFSPTFTAVGLARGADGRTRLLLREPSGAAVLVTLTADGQVQGIAHHRAAGFAAVALALEAGPDSRPRLLFDNGQGQAEVWTISADGRFQSRFSFALPSGYAAQSLGVGQAGDLRVLSSGPDGSGVLQTLTAHGAQTGSTVLTPYQ